MSGRITTHFTRREARCRCGRCQVDPAPHPWASIAVAARKLERLRLWAGGRPLQVDSWFRCEHHPIEAAKPPEGLHRHTTGLAVDIGCSGIRRLKLIELARPAGFLSVGVYRWGVHVDSVPGDIARHWVNPVPRNIRNPKGG